MVRNGELSYYSQIGDEGQEHAISKPFSDPECSEMLCDLAFIISKLPPPPSKILECGCGSGWLTFFLAKLGYQCVGQDISKDAIQLAKNNPLFRKTGNIQFICNDFEDLNANQEYDAVIFYSSLHHSEDEMKTIQSAYNILKKNGIFLSVEPGRGHKKRSKQIREIYDLNDRDMPPSLQIKCGKRAGFKRFKIYMHPAQIFKIFYRKSPPRSGKIKKYLMAIPGFRYFALCFIQFFYKRYNGSVWMIK